MKKVSIILSHLSNQPQFKLLKQQGCYEQYLQLLNKSLGQKYQKIIAFIYVKNETLFIAIKHPGFKMELNYNRDLLKSLLTQFISFKPECKNMQSSKVVIFYSKFHPVSQASEKISTVPRYSELAQPNFKILSTDSKLIEKFKQIQEKIQCNL